MTEPQPPPTASKPVDPTRERFEVELEFVQCLASPSYLNCTSRTTHRPKTASNQPIVLAQNEYFDSPNFIAYLKYLLYWRAPQYARFIIFPHALYFLQLLQEPAFRDALKRADYTMMLHQQLGFNWQFQKTMKIRASETTNGSSGPMQASPEEAQPHETQ